MVRPVVIAWLGASTAWCFCAPAAPSASSGHACCEDGAGLVPGDGGCCRNAAPGQTARQAVVDGGGSPSLAIAAAVVPALAVGFAPLPAPQRAVSSPAVVLRI